MYCKCEPICSLEFYNELTRDRAANDTFSDTEKPVVWRTCASSVSWTERSRYNHRKIYRATQCSSQRSKVVIWMNGLRIRSRGPDCLLKKKCWRLGLWTLWEAKLSHAWTVINVGSKKRGKQKRDKIIISRSDKKKYTQTQVVIINFKLWFLYV